MKTDTGRLEVTSPVFENEAAIPVKYSCDGEGINPPLHIENLPRNTKTLALIAEDPDAPNGTFDHWIEWNIEPVNDIPEGSNPGISGSNSAGQTGYHPACPPTGSHRYYFHLYALNAHLQLRPGTRKKDLLAAMEGHVIAKGSLMGRYERKK